MCLDNAPEKRYTIDRSEKDANKGDNMSISVKKYGECDGKIVNAYTLDNGKDLCAEILNYGGTLTRLVYKGTDVVLGWGSFDEYLDNNLCFGSTIGRNSNRIENAEFELNGKVYKLCANNGRNNIHGGQIGFHKKVWEAATVDGDEPALVLSYFSPDGEEGFPGNAEIQVTYTLTADNGIQIHYEATCDSDTVINMTNHSYFNLNGHDSGSVEGHNLWLASHFYTPNTEEVMPYGEIHSVQGTPFDFSTETKIGDRLAMKHKQIEMFGGFDHNFVIDGKGYRLAAKAKGEKSGIAMEMYTDRPGVQIYTPKKFTPDRKYKDGATYVPLNAFCLETQAFPNGLKFSHYPDVVLKKGEKYDTTTTYKFS